MLTGGRSGSLSGGGGRRAAERSRSVDDGVAGSSSGLGRQPPPSQQLEQLERAEILQEQDALLDRMSVSMGALQHISGAITGELEVQATLMEQTSLAVEVAQGDMEAVTKRVNKLVEKAGGPQWCGVLTCLTTVLAILTFIAFS
jgi:hypothetical protein